MKRDREALKSAILSRVREVWERKVLDRIEPTDALIIRDNIYLKISGKAHDFSRGMKAPQCG